MRRRDAVRRDDPRDGRRAAHARRRSNDIGSIPPGEARDPRDRADARRCVRHAHPRRRSAAKSPRRTTIQTRLPKPRGRTPRVLHAVRSTNSATARPERRSRTTDGLWAVLVKEFLHIRRQPSTIFFMLVVPVMQTIIFGYAIDTQIEHIPHGRVRPRRPRHGRAAGRGVREHASGSTSSSDVQDEADFRRAITVGRREGGGHDSAELLRPHRPRRAGRRCRC